MLFRPNCSNVLGYLAGTKKVQNLFTPQPSLPVHGGKICCLLALGVPAGMLIFVARRVAT